MCVSVDLFSFCAASDSNSSSGMIREGFNSEDTRLSLVTRHDAASLWWKKSGPVSSLLLFF